MIIRKFKQYRFAFSCIGVLMFFVGYLGFIISVVTGAYIEIGLHNDPKPLYTVNGISADSRGNIYYGNGNHSSIQVYDNEGAFLYRFSFPSGNGAYFIFYIDEHDIVHVAAARGNSVISFKDGVLLNERNYRDGQDRENTRKKFERQRENSHSNGDNKYLIFGRTIIRHYDSQGTHIKTFRVSAPIWPFHPMMYMFMAKSGIGLFLLSNLKFATSLFKMMINAKRIEWW